MNTRLLQRVRDTISAQPRRFSAAQWAFARNKRAVLDDDAQPDGFRCCIAGHVLLEESGGSYDERGLLCEGGFHDAGHLWERAAEAAGLSKAQRNELFFPSQWDAPYKKNYYLSGRDEEADVCASYITHFLEKHAGAAPETPESRRTAPDRAPVPGSASTREATRDGAPTRILRRAVAALRSIML